jgi:exopolysaccharide biosynthesis polyprenyl glycosylphosphotransferase
MQFSHFFARTLKVLSEKRIEELMVFKSTSAMTNLGLDLRSPISTRFRRGILVTWFRVLALVVLDIMSISLAWRLALHWGTEIQSVWTTENGLRALPLILAIVIGVVAARRLYAAGDSRRDYLGMVKAIVLAEVMLALVAFLYDPQAFLSRSSFLMFLVLSLLITCVSRFGFDWVIRGARKRGMFRYPVFVIADSQSRVRNLDLIQRAGHYTIAGVTDSSALDRANREAMFESLKAQRVVEAFVSWSAIKDRLYLCWRFQTAGITLRVLPTQNESFLVSDAFLARAVFWMLGEVPCITVESPVIIGGDYWIKRCLDFCCALALINLLSPLYLLISILIRLDSPGPIFFRQTRIGLYGQQFKVWKFRTMVTDADKLQANLESSNEIKDGVLFKMKNDPRITPIGKFLRQYSLDELPQLFNVLLGEMSFVGPRPLPIRDVEKFQQQHFIRQDVLPGITGLWQVSGRSDIESFSEAVKLDLKYIVNWSLWLDLQIMLRTVLVVFQKSGAY